MPVPGIRPPSECGCLSRGRAPETGTWGWWHNAPCLRRCIHLGSGAPPACPGGSSVHWGARRYDTNSQFAMHVLRSQCLGHQHTWLSTDFSVFSQHSNVASFKNGFYNAYRKHRQQVVFPSRVINYLHCFLVYLRYLNTPSVLFCIHPFRWEAATARV